MATYKIGDIESLTGIKAHTIRVWEKRYGLIKPDRSTSKIRKYSEKDLSTLLNVSILNKHGYKISHISKLTPKQLVQEVWKQKAINKDDVFFEQLILALLNMDEGMFKGVVDDTIAKFGFEYAYMNMLIPFLDRIGVMWQTGSINPAQEHFMSNLIRQYLIIEVGSLDIPEKDGRLVVLYLPEHEWHEISLLFYYYVLRKRGIRSFYLGQSVPYDSLLEIIKRMKPEAILTSWLTSVDQRNIVNYFKKLRRDCPELRVFAGGAQVDRYESVLKPYLTVVSGQEFFRETKLFDE